MSPRWFLAPVAALLALSGCFGGAQMPDALMTLTPAQTRAAAQPRTASAGQAITVTTPDAPRAISTSRIPVYVDDTTIQYLPDAQWVEPPADLLRGLLSETIAARTGLAVLDPSLYTQTPSVVLSGQLLRFGLDPNAHEVVVDYEGALARPDAAVVTNRFSAHVAVADESPAAVGAALNEAANQVAGQVADWVAG
jgi:cholesterol transport system auxiliary component